VVFTEGFAHGTAGLSDVVGRALDAKPDLLFAPVYYAEAAAILNELASVKSSLTVLGAMGGNLQSFSGWPGRICGRDRSISAATSL